MAGSLLELHSHNNLNILNELSEASSILYYKGKKIAGIADISKEPNNAIIGKSDGIYVDGKLLCTSDEKDLLSKLSIDPTQGLMVNGKQVGHSHNNKDILDKFSIDTENALLYNGNRVRLEIQEIIDIEKAIQDTLIILDAVDTSIEELNREE